MYPKSFCEADPPVSASGPKSTCGLPCHGQALDLYDTADVLFKAAKLPQALEILENVANLVPIKVRLS